MKEDLKQNVYQEFYNKINLSPAELEKWLKTDQSKSVGEDSGDGEAIGHKSGTKIVKIKRKLKEDLTEEDYSHMQKVNAYIARHTAQRPEGDIKNSNWRYALMNWGYDPMKK